MEFGQLAARYRRAPISEAEMEAIEVRVYISIKVLSQLTLAFSFNTEWWSYFHHLKKLIEKQLQLNKKRIHFVHVY